MKKNDYDIISSRLHYDPAIKISKVEFLNDNDQICMNFKNGDALKLRIHFACERIVENPFFCSIYM